LSALDGAITLNPGSSNGSRVAKDVTINSMSLKHRIHLLIGLTLGIGFILFATLSYQAEKAAAEANLLASADQVRSVLMATRRVYHHQFIDSGLPLNEKTIGFLPAHALSQISRDLTNWDKTGFSFNNVSDQPRNLTQKADETEMSAIEYFRQHPKAELRFVAFTSANGEPYYHYARPIWIEQYCLQCHGDRNQAPDTIRDLYDTAYDYQVGELRGILSIKIPARTIQAQLRHGFLFTLAWTGCTLLLLWSAVGFVIRRDVLRPLASLKSGINHLAGGVLSGRVGTLPGEFGVIGQAFDDMASTLELEQTRLASSEQSFRYLATTATDAIILATADDKILFWNEGAERIFGYRQSEIINQSITTIIPERFREAHSSAMQRILQGGSGTHFGHPLELTGLRRDGVEIPVEISLNTWESESKHYFVAIIRDITDRKHTEIALRESENRFRRILGLTSDLIYSCHRAEDGLFRIEWIGGNAEHLFGHPIEELMNLGCWCGFVVEDDLPLFASHITALKPGQSSEVVLRIRHGDGSLRHLCSYAEVEEDSNSRGQHRLFGALQDVSEHKNFEASLQESEARFRSLADSAPVLIWVAETDKGCSWFNKTWLDYTGRSLEQEHGSGWTEGVHPDDLQHSLEIYTSHFDTRQPFQMEYRLRGRDGEYHWFIDVGKPRYGEHNQFLGYIGMMTDITERKQIEETIRFRQFSLDHAGEDIFWIGKNGRILDANQPACRKLGYSREEMLQLTVADIDAFFPFSQWPEHWQALKQNKTLRFESCHKRRDGIIFPTEIVANYFEYGGLEYNCALVRDISERKAFEQALKEKTEYLDTILRSEPECVKVVAKDGQLLEMNPAGLKLLEVDSVEEAREYGLINFLLPEFRPLFLKLHRQVFLGKSGSLEFIIEGKRGSRYWLDTHAAPLFDEHGKVKALVGVTRDITERINLLQELEHQAKSDFLTGLANRRHFLELAELEIARAQRYDNWLSMLMMDIDFFKNINDTYGHKAGDLVLQKFATICKNILREIDVIGRMGGEEFAILLPETAGERALEVAQRLRQEIENTRVVWDNQDQPIQFTVSIGVATMATPQASVESILQEADTALYQAKNTGRNSVIASF